MRPINLFFLCVLLFSLPIDLAAQQHTIRQEMERLHRERGINFVYDASINTDIIFKGKPLAVNGSKSTKELLYALFKDTDIIFEQRGSHVVLKSGKNPIQETSRPAARRTFTISGYVRNNSGETLINATVYDKTSSQGTMTNAYGFYSLTLDEGEHLIRYGYIGCNDTLKTVDLKSNLTIDIRLTESINLAEVIVTGDLNSQLINTQTGKRSLSADDIKTEFSLFSSPDVVKTLQRISGVASGVELASGLYVHGGDNDENLYLLDGSPLYQVNHSLGLFSSFNAEIIKNVDFYKSGFPARYGGRLSSVVDVRTRDGDLERYHGNYRIGMLDGGVQIEGPIRKGKTSFNFGLRRSWLDIITRPVLAIYNNTKGKDEEKMTFNYFFHDINAKMTNIFSDRSRLSFSAYSGKDGLSSNYEDGNNYYISNYKSHSKADLNWGNINLALDWQYQFSPKLFANFTGVYTYNLSKLSTDQKSEEIASNGKAIVENSNHSYSSTINDLGYRVAFDYRPSAHHHIRYGTDYIWHRFRPQTNEFKRVYHNNVQTDTTTDKSRNYHSAHEWIVYAEDEMTFNEHWSLNVGLNASMFVINGKTFAAADPRMAMKYQLSSRLSFKASATAMTQYVHKVSNSFLELPTDYWVPTTARLKPMHSWQMAAGIYWQPNRHWILSAEGYLKDSRHLLQYTSWSGLEPPAGNWDQYVMDGRGHYYGMELDATFKTHRLQVQGTYTLSWNKRLFKEFHPEWFYDKFDNRHNINITARWDITDKVSMYAAWLGHSGNHITIPTHYIKIPSLPGSNSHDVERFVYERPNNFTLPFYHRMDLGFDFRHTNKRGRERIWNISLYNVYCHMNSMFVTFDFYNNEGKFKIKNHAFIPIIPSVSYTLKF